MDYYNFINLTNDNQPGQNLNFINFMIIYDEIFTWGYDIGESDGVVTKEDEIAIFNNINSQNKKIKEIFGYNNHGEVADLSETKKEIKNFVDG